MAQLVNEDRSAKKEDDQKNRPDVREQILQDIGGHLLERKGFERGRSVPPRLGIRREDGGKRFGFERRKRGQTVFNHSRNRKKRDLARQKLGHCDFIGRIENRRGGAAGDHRFPREAEARVASFFDRRELQPDEPRKIQRGFHSRRPRRVKQRVLDGK